MRRKVVLALAALTTLGLPQQVFADSGPYIGPYSSQVEPHRAAIGARISVVRTKHPQRSSRATRERAAAPVSVREIGGAVPNPPSASYPSIRPSSPLLRNPRPAGPQSFWYGDGTGHVCIYQPGSVLPCFTVTTPAGPGLGPAAVAASIARRIPLTPGEINASPAQSGLTGADAWFWLDPAPTRKELSVTLGGETVSVVAEPVVEWRFGDGATHEGGPGVPYRSGEPPAEAIWHVYQTRCLPGDPGHNPYVLPSCGADGYTVAALVVWRISFAAAGPIDANGTLPTRTTATSISYAVSEARAFLGSGGES